MEVLQCRSDPESFVVRVSLPCRVCHTILVMVGEPEKLNEGPARPGQGSALDPGMELTDRPPLAYDLTSGAQARTNELLCLMAGLLTVSIQTEVHK